MENNWVKLRGTVVSAPEVGHRIYGETFYKTVMAVPRLSGVCDMIPVTVSERLLPDIDTVANGTFSVSGQFRSYNNYSGIGSRLQLVVFAKTFLRSEEATEENPNDIAVDGYLCKAPVFRETPFGREIADLLLAVNRAYGKSDYLPVIAWSRNARFCGKLPVGTHLRISGRIQSRDYQKHIGEEIEVRTAYEISASKIELPDEESYT